MSEIDNDDGSGADVDRLISPAVFVLMVGFAVVVFLATAPATRSGLLTGMAQTVLYLLVMAPITIMATKIEVAWKRA